MKGTKVDTNGLNSKQVRQASLTNFENRRSAKANSGERTGSVITTMLDKMGFPEDTRLLGQLSTSMKDHATEGAQAIEQVQRPEQSSRAERLLAERPLKGHPLVEHPFKDRQEQAIGIHPNFLDRQPQASDDGARNGDKLHRYQTTGSIQDHRHQIQESFARRQAAKDGCIAQPLIRQRCGEIQHRLRKRSTTED
jgi:hypothetical protein